MTPLARYKNCGLLGMFCLICGLCIFPCMAAENYFSGGPDLAVSLQSTNELVPGATTDLPVLVENRGTITMEMYNQFTIRSMYIPTTAMGATVQLLPGNAPVLVKTNPQKIGDVAAGAIIPASFVVQVPQDVPAGNYTMLARITYQYMPRAEQETTTDIEYYFKDDAVTLPVPVTVRPIAMPSVVSVESLGLHAGGEGYLAVTMNNTGHDTGRAASVYLVPSGVSPLVPSTNGLYIGDFAPGNTTTARFKVTVAQDADFTQTYPIGLYLKYTDFEGNMVQSPVVNTGVDFTQKIRFRAQDDPVLLHPGKTYVVNVTYTNVGTAPAYNAQARISVVDPFSSEDDTAYLGTVRPGQSATAIFSIKTDGTATPKTYSINSEIQYTDLSNTEYTSDTIRVLAAVEDETAPVLPVVLLAVVAAGVLVYVIYRKTRAV